MFGFLIGTACLVGLVVMARGAHCPRARHRGGWGFRGHHQGQVLNAVLDRLDTTPGQEKVIRTAIHDFLEEARSVRREFKASRRGFAEAVRKSEFEHAALQEAFLQHDASLAQLRAAIVEALSRIHETLDERQRRSLAELLENGPFGWGGGFRSVL